MVAVLNPMASRYEIDVEFDLQSGLVEGAEPFVAAEIGRVYSYSSGDLARNGRQVRPLLAVCRSALHE